MKPAPARQTSEWWWIFDPRQSLRVRAALWVGTALLAFTLLLTWVAGIVLHRVLEKQTGSMLETLAFQVSDKLDRTLFERSQTLQLTASLASMGIASTPTADRRRVLEAVQVTTPDFAWVGVTDATGQVQAATNRHFEGAPMGERPWFRGARERLYIGGPHERPDLVRQVPASENGEASSQFIDLAVPILGPDGEFAGVLAAHLRWNWAHDVQRSVIPDAQQRDRIGVTVYAGPRDVLLDSGVSGWTEPPEAPEVPETRRFRGSLVENAGGTVYLSGYVRSRGHRDYRGLGWLTVVRQPEAFAFAAVEDLRRNISAWGVAFAIAAAAGAWVIAGRFSRKLRSIGATAIRIQSGDILAVMPRPPGESEMSRMCGALGDMVDDFRRKQPAPELETNSRDNRPI